MIQEPTTEQIPRKPSRMKKTIVISLIAALCIGIALFFVIKQLHIQQINKLGDTSIKKPVEVHSIDSLTASAFNKLEKGDQKGGLDDLQLALVQAKSNNDAEQVKYLEQQIDFAKNTKFTKQNESIAPAPSPSRENTPNIIVR